LAEIVSESDLAVGRLYPPLSEIRNVSVKIAAKVAEEAYRNGLASTYPEPEDKVSMFYNFYSPSSTYKRSSLFRWNYNCKEKFNKMNQGIL
jgi:malic enzyme